jgi:hypothetical protein
MAKDSMSTILILGAVGVAGWYAYSSGMLAQFGLAPAGAAPPAAPPPPAPTGGGAATPPAVPALGTPVTSAAQALAQVAANDAFILPDPVTAAALQSALPGGYNWIQTSDKGIIFLRPDVYAAASTLLTNRIQRAAGASPASQQAASQISLADIQTMMSTQGLSGFDDFRRHMFMRTGRA